MRQVNFLVFENPVVSAESADAMSRRLLAALDAKPYRSAVKRTSSPKARNAYRKSPRLFSRMLRALCDPRVEHAVRGAISNPVVHHVDVLIKDPHGPATIWHQDRYYWREFDEPVSMMTLWVSLVPCDIQNGCLRLLETLPPQRELYAHGVHEHDAGQGQYAIESHILDRVVEEPKVADVELPTGGAVMFDSFAVHSAYANETSDYRLAYKIVVGSADSLKQPYLFRVYGGAWKLGKRVGFLPQFALALLRGK